MVSFLHFETFCPIRTLRTPRPQVGTLGAFWERALLCCSLLSTKYGCWKGIRMGLIGVV